MCSQWAYHSLSVILILSNLHLTRASLKDTGLVSESPPHPLTIAQFYEWRRNPGQRASATISPAGKMLSRHNCLASSHYSDISKTRGPGEGVSELTFVWHFSCNIYLLRDAWHLRCFISPRWIEPRSHSSGLIWHVGFGRKGFNPRLSRITVPMKDVVGGRN